MWNYTIISMVNGHGCQPTEKTDISSIWPVRSATAMYKDGMRIRQKLVKVMDASDRALTTKLERVDAYLKKLERCAAIEELAVQCQQLGVEMEKRLVDNGQTLKAAMDETEDFLSKSDPFQEFDRVYERCEHI